jgi:hypothetical protein
MRASTPATTVFTRLTLLLRPGCGCAAAAIARSLFRSSVIGAEPAIFAQFTS